MLRKQTWKRIYDVAHLGCLASIFSLVIAPPIALSFKGSMWKGILIGLSIPLGLALICFPIAFIAWRMYERTSDS